MGNKCTDCLYIKESGWKEPCRNCKHAYSKRLDSFVPAEPVVLSAAEIFEKSFGKIITGPVVSEYGKAMHQNGRLERELELREVRERTENLFDVCCRGSFDLETFFKNLELLRESIKNLKQLNQD